MSKRILLLLLVIIMTMSLFAGCGGNGGKDATSEGAKAGDGTEPITLTISHIWPTADVVFEEWEAFAANLEDKTDGRIVVNMFGNKQISSTNNEDAENVQQNVTQMTTVPSFTIASVSDIKAFNLYDFPFLFRSDEEIYMVAELLQEEVGDALITKTGMRFYPGFNTNWNKIGVKGVDKVTSYKDIAGKKIRVSSSELLLATFNALGTTPVPMAYGEIFTALQQGTIDGVSTTTSLYLTDKFAEVVDAMLVTNITPIVHTPLVNESWYQSLPDDLKVIFDDCVAEFVSSAGKATLKSEQDALKELESHLTVNYFTDEQLADWAAQTQFIWDDYAHLVGEDFMAKLRNALGR